MKMNLTLGGNRVLIHVDVVLVNGGHYQLIALRFHPRRHKRSQFQPGRSVKHQLVVYYLIRRFLQYRLLRHPEPVQTLISISISAKKYQIKENQMKLSL